MAYEPAWLAGQIATVYVPWLFASLLTRLGLTLPGFVNRNKIIASMPSLGLLTLAGLTPRSHEVHYLEVADLKTAGNIPNDFDLVAISSFTAKKRR